jgi:hypothetical protein
MAITINSNPTGGQSVQDNMWHVVSSDRSGTTDFRYVFDVWINGTQKVRVKQYPDPTTGKGYFDAGPIVRNSMTYEWFEPINSSAYVAQPDMSGQIGIIYQLRVGEDYTGLTTTNMASGEVSGYNWAPPLFKRRSVGLSTKLNNWLTNRPLIAYTKLGENLFIPFYCSPGTSLNLKVNTFLQDGTQDNSVSGSTVVCTNGFVQMNIGTTAIFNSLAMTIDERIRYYDVWFNNLTKIRVYTTCNPKYTPVLVHFLNRWGMWDTQRFDLVSKLTMDVDRKQFQKREYKFGSTVDYYSSSNRYYEGKINHSNVGNWTYKLTADAMTDDEYTWMADLITSPQILMELDGFFYPVCVKSTNYEYSKFENNKLKALELEFEMNQPRRTQLR